MTRIADPLKQEELQLGEDEELVDLLTEIDQELRVLRKLLKKRK
jgi:hypothetical protein